MQGRYETNERIGLEKTGNSSEEVRMGEEVRTRSERQMERKRKWERTSERWDGGDMEGEWKKRE